MSPRLQTGYQVRVLGLLFAILLCSSAAAQQALTLKDVNTLWPVLSPPATHAELMDRARRLDLTHEQIIAAERMHATYLDDAFALRQRANDTLLALDSAWLLVPEVPPIESDWRKMLAIRRTYLRDLSQRDDVLLAQIGEMLTDSQRTAMPYVQLRRARVRLLADGFVAPWLHEAPLVELADLLDELDLTPDQRAAAAPIIDDFERKATRALEKLEDRIHDMRLGWLEFAGGWHNDVKQPPWEQFVPSMLPLAEPARAVLDSEYEAMDRLKTVLPIESWRALGMRQAVVAGSWGPDSASGLVSIDALQRRDDITDAQRTALQALRIELAPRYDEAAFETARGFRRYRWTNPVTLGPTNMGRFLTNEEWRAVMDEFRASSDGYGQVSQDAKARLEELFGAAQYKALRSEITVVRDRDREQRERDDAALGGNVVAWSWNLQPWELLSDAPSQELLERAALAAGASALQTDALRAAHHDLVSAVQAAVGRMDQATRAATREQFRLDWPDRGRAMAMAAADTVAEIDARDAAFGLAVEQALAGSPAAERAWIITLARDWEVLASGPRNLPPPMEFTYTSQQQNVVALLDRVNPVAVLVKMYLDDAARVAALLTLRERTPAIGAMGRQIRIAAPQAFTNTILVQAESHKTSNERTRDDWKRYEQIQKDANASALDVMVKRRDLLKSIGEAMAAVEQTLPDEPARNAFHEAVGRVAYPIAWNPVRSAALAFERAERLPDVTDAQRSAVHDAAVVHASAMREAARRVEELLNAYSQADMPQHDARCRAALCWAPLEQALLQLTEQQAAAPRMLRPILTPAQMQAIESSPAAR